MKIGSQSAQTQCMYVRYRCKRLFKFKKKLSKSNITKKILRASLSCCMPQIRVSNKLKKKRRKNVVVVVYINALSSLIKKSVTLLPVFPVYIISGDTLIIYTV